MATWFFDSLGEPIAFVGMNNLIFHKSGTFLGLLVDGKIWSNRASYVGEIVHSDRLFRDRITVYLPKVFPMLPYETSLTDLPSSRAKQSPPPGFADLEFDEEGYVIL